MSCKRYISVILLFFALTTQSQGPNFSWAKSSGGDHQDQGNAVAADANHNVIITGGFASDTINFGSVTLAHSHIGFSDFFLTKYNSAGTLLWAKGAAGTQDRVGKSVATDPNGNIFVTGFFAGSYVAFGTSTLTNFATGYADAFVTKYDANGNVLWAKKIGGMYDEYGAGIVADINGNVFVTGYFRSPTAVIGTTSLTNAGSSVHDIFVLKFDAGGNLLWSKAIGGSQEDWGLAIAVDASGNVLVTGQFQSASIDFGGTIINNTVQSYYDAFIVKYSTSGTVLWAKNAGGSSDDFGNGVISDANDNVVVTGCYYSSTMSFGTSTLVNYSNQGDIFLTKYDQSGNVIWARRAGGKYSEGASSVSSDAGGNPVIVGASNSDTLTFGNITLVSNGLGSDFFVAKYDAAGNALWGTLSGGTSFNQLTDVCTDPNGDVFIVGYYGSTISCGTITLSLYLGGLSAVLVSKIEATVTGLYENPLEQETISIFPNPSAGSFELQLRDKPGDAKLILINAMGEKVHEQHVAQGSNKIYLPEISSGFYSCILVADDKTISLGKILVE